MKKLLSILSAIGITATASSTVVACGTVNADKPTKNNIDNNKSPEESLSQLKQELAQAKADKAALAEKLDEEEENSNKIVQNSQSAITSANGVIKEQSDKINSLNDQLDQANKAAADGDATAKAKIDDLTKQLAAANDKLDEANKDLAKAQADLSNAQKTVANLQAKLKDAAAKEDSLSKEIEKLESALANPIVMGEVSQTAGSTDYSKFDIKLKNAPDALQGDIDTKLVSIITTGFDDQSITISKASISDQVLHVELNKGLTPQYDYITQMGYSIQFGISQTVLNGDKDTEVISQGYSQFMNIPAKQSASIMDTAEINFSADRTSFTMQLTGGTAIDGEIQAAANIFALNYVGSSDNMPKVASASVAANVLTITLDKPMPEDRDMSSTYGYDLVLNKSTNGIHWGISTLFSINRTNDNSGGNNEDQNFTETIEIGYQDPDSYKLVSSGYDAIISGTSEDAKLVWAAINKLKTDNSDHVSPKFLINFDEDEGEVFISDPSFGRGSVGMTSSTMDEDKVDYSTVFADRQNPDFSHWDGATYSDFTFMGVYLNEHPTDYEIEQSNDLLKLGFKSVSWSAPDDPRNPDSPLTKSTMIVLPSTFEKLVPYLDSDNSIKKEFIPSDPDVDPSTVPWFQILSGKTGRGVDVDGLTLTVAKHVDHFDTLNNHQHGDDYDLVFDNNGASDSFNKVYAGARLHLHTEDESGRVLKAIFDDSKVYIDPSFEPDSSVGTELIIDNKILGKISLVIGGFDTEIPFNAYDSNKYPNGFYIEPFKYDGWDGRLSDFDPSKIKPLTNEVKEYLKKLGLVETKILNMLPAYAATPFENWNGTPCGFSFDK